jgi:hypothetical protein
MRTRLPIPRGAVVLALALALAAACGGRSLREGAQMLEVPAGFELRDSVQSPNDVLPGFDRLPQRAYLLHDKGRVAAITISEYPHVVGEREVRAAYETQRAKVDFATFGELEPVRIGRRDGWGWSETASGHVEHMSALQWSVVVPWDDRTFLLEYFANVPALMDLERMKEQLGRFVWVRRGRIVR